MVEVITGKGNNSVNNNPKLYPKLKDWLLHEDILHQAKQDEGRIFVYLPI
jgi:DNA-nicking Smr family endonuclease